MAAPRAHVAAEANRLIFGHAQFRPLQAEVIAAAMRGADAFVLLPTGADASERGRRTDSTQHLHSQPRITKFNRVSLQTSAGG